MLPAHPRNCPQAKGENRLPPRGGKILLSEPRAAAERAEHFVHGFDRKRETQNDGGAAGNILPHGVIEKVAIEGLAMADRASIALRQSIANLGTSRVIFQ